MRDDYLIQLPGCELEYYAKGWESKQMPQVRNNSSMEPIYVRVLTLKRHEFNEDEFEGEWQYTERNSSGWLWDFTFDQIQNAESFISQLPDDCKGEILTLEELAKSDEERLRETNSH